MSSTATNEPLFIRCKTGADLFEKTADVLARMPDDEKKWPAQILSELYRSLPFITQYDPEVVIDRMEPEAGAALGYAQIRNRTMARPQDDAGRGGNVIRVPILVQDHRLQPFLVFEAGGQTYPLTEERIEQAMLNPALFDTTSKGVPSSPSLVDAMYPPYQQRQGFGRVVEPGAAGLSKISSAPQKVAFTGPFVEASGLGVPSALGYVLGRDQRPLPGGERTQAKEKYNILAGLFVPGYTGYHFGRRAAGKAAVEAEASSSSAKAAAVALNFQKGQGLPGPQVFEKMVGKPRFKIGVIPQDYWFYPLPGTKFLMGIPKASQAILEKETDPQKKTQIVRSLALGEIRAGMQGLPSPGEFVLVTRDDKGGFKYESPMMGVGGRPLQKAAEVKEARIFGAAPPDNEYLVSPAFPYRHRVQSVKDYWGKKGKEKPTSRVRALTTGSVAGGALGGLVGGTYGAGVGRIGRSAAIGAVGGAALGALAGHIAREGDVKEISKSKKLFSASPEKQDKAIRKTMHYATSSVAEEQRLRHDQNIRAQRDLADAFRSSGTTHHQHFYGAPSMAKSQSVDPSPKYECPYCGTHSSSTIGNCSGCGAPKSGAKKIASYLRNLPHRRLLRQ